MGNAAAMPPTSASATPTIKLLIAKDAQVVVLAEAGKDVVDFLLGLLAMPIGAACKLIAGKDKESSPLGALATVYASVQQMDSSYMQSQETRDALLNPAPAHPALVAAAGGFPSLVQPAAAAAPPPHQAPAPAPPHGPSKASSSSSPGLSSLKGLAALPPFNVGNSPCHCDACLAAQAQGSKGFVRGLVTYTITDELTITPMSNISSIALLHRLGLGVEDLGALEERTVKIGYQEGLEILRASLLSPKTVLTDVFLTAKKQKKRARTAGDKNGATGEKARVDPATTATGKELATE